MSIRGKKRETERLTIGQRFRDAINAFRGKKVGSLQFGIDVKECNKCERTVPPSVMYLCDRKKCLICTYPRCKYTVDHRHAKNFHYSFTAGYVEVFAENDVEEDSNSDVHSINPNDLVDEEGTPV